MVLFSRMYNIGSLFTLSVHECAFISIPPFLQSFFFKQADMSLFLLLFLLFKSSPVEWGLALCI